MQDFKNYKLTISYIGDNYKGWQKQNNGQTVQAVLEDLLSNIFKSSVKLKYSSRTDSGVHAFGQVANFLIKSKLSEENLLLSLNSQLPWDIVIKSIDIVSLDFDARKSSKKEYKYLIDIAKCRDPFRHNRYWRPRCKIDINKLKAGLKLFIGTKNFKSFMAVDGCSKTTIRTVHDLYLTEYVDKLELTIIANGFLKQMVRNIVGTLVDLSRGKYDINDIEKMFILKDRKSAGVTAPAYGLYLDKVYYD